MMVWLWSWRRILGGPHTPPHQEVPRWKPQKDSAGSSGLFVPTIPRPHVAGVCRKCFDDEGIDIIDGIRQSLDLNPVEHLWDIKSLCIRCYLVPPKTVQEFTNALIHIWEKPASADSSRRLITSISEYCLEFIQGPAKLQRHNLSCCGENHAVWMRLWFSSFTLIFWIWILFCIGLNKSPNRHSLSYQNPMSVLGERGVNINTEVDLCSKSRTHCSVLLCSALWWCFCVGEHRQQYVYSSLCFCSGCMRDLRLNGRYMPMDSQLRDGVSQVSVQGLSPGCLSDSCKKNQCTPPFTCVDLWRVHECRYTHKQLQM